MTFGLLFEGEPEAQAVPVQVEFSGVNATFGKASPANSDTQGYFTLAVGALAANEPVTVFLTGRLAIDGEVEPWVRIDESVARNGSALDVAGRYSGARYDLSRKSDGTLYNTQVPWMQQVRQSGNRIVTSDVFLVNGSYVTNGYGPVFDVAPDGGLAYLGQSTTPTGFGFSAPDPEYIYYGTLVDQELNWGWKDADYDTCNCESDRTEYQLTRSPP